MTSSGLRSLTPEERDAFAREVAQTLNQMVSAFPIASSQRNYGRIIYEVIDQMWDEQGMMKLDSDFLQSFAEILIHLFPKPQGFEDYFILPAVAKVLEDYGVPSSLKLGRF